MATDDREKYRAHEFWRFRAQASQTPAHPTEADRRARIESQKTGAFVAAIRPQLRAARQTLSRSDMAALQRGVVRLHRRGQTVEQVSEFVDAFTANPAAFRDRFPEPPPIDPHNHQLKPKPDLKEIAAREYQRQVEERRMRERNRSHGFTQRAGRSRGF